MSIARDFDFGMGPDLGLFSTGKSLNGIDHVVEEIHHLRFPSKKGSERVARRRRSSIETNFSFELPQSPISPFSSAASIHSAISTTELPTSSYWHIPDKSSYLTSIAVQKNNNLCAIGSGGQSDNLFLYEVYPDEVTHHQTVTLPEIHSLEWVSPDTQLGRMGNVLVSGHKNGVAHLTMLPDASARDGNAEILKRYNHVKHLPSGIRPRSLRIRSLKLTSSAWSCTVPSSLFSLCGDHIFLWEPNRSDVPLVVQKSPNANSIALCNSRDGVYALGRKKGVCIRDIRIRDRVNSGLKPPIDNDESVGLVNWNPFDGGFQLAAVHDRTTIKIWDIRNKAPLAIYKRHADTINSIEWSAKSELISASADGTVRVWDTERTESDVKPQSANSDEGANTATESSRDWQNSSWNEYMKRQSLDSDLEEFANDLLSGTLPINQNRNFVGMSLTPMGPATGAVTIDSDGFLGIHELCDRKDPREFSVSNLGVSSGHSFSAPPL